MSLVPHTSYLLIHILWGLPPGPPVPGSLQKTFLLSSSSLQFKLNLFSPHLFFLALYSSSSKPPPAAAAPQPLVALFLFRFYHLPRYFQRY
ncbi:hypothetical protein HDV57DRAFT_143148 [Trichoderma longibrachiatum]